MRYHLRWQLILALLGFLLVFSLLVYEEKEPALVISAETCTNIIPANGGIYAEGIVGAPVTLNPLLADGRPVDEELVGLIYDGLTRFDENGRLTSALAQDWSVSEDGRTVRFILRQGVLWHDGTPFTSNDVAATYRLMQQDDFAGNPDLKALWQTITITPIDQHTIEFVLAEPYSPFMEATTRGILPAHLLSNTPLAQQTLNIFPVGTGPFMVDASLDWQQTRRLRLLPNPQSNIDLKLEAIEFHFYPSEQALLDAFAQDNIQAINQIHYTALPTIAQNREARLFTAPANRMTQLFFNTSESGHPALTAVNRRALAYALDRQQIVNEALNGQGLIFDGPYLPSNARFNLTPLTQFSYQPLTATTQLDESGWLTPEGSTIRQQEEEPFNLRFLLLDTPRNRTLYEKINQQWLAVGVATTPTFAPDFATLQTILAERTFDVALVDITPPKDPDLYDFWSQEAIIRGQNYAGWNNRRASEALEAARQTWNRNERNGFYSTFLRLYDSDLPAITLFQHTYTYAVSDTINNLDIGRIHTSRDRYQSLSNWFMLFREVNVPCPIE